MKRREGPETAEKKMKKDYIQEKFIFTVKSINLRKMVNLICSPNVLKIIYNELSEFFLQRIFDLQSIKKP